MMTMWDGGAKKLNFKSCKCKVWIDFRWSEFKITLMGYRKWSESTVV